MTTTLRAIWLWLQVLCAAALTVGAWGLAAVWLLGFAVNPSALTRINDDGSPTWPYQAGIVIILGLIGFGGYRLTRVALRRRRAPRPTPQQARAPRAAPARRADPLTPAQRIEARAHKRALRRASGPSSRVKLFTLGALILGAVAILSGYVVEWRGEEPQGFASPGIVLSLATLAASFVLGVWASSRLKRGRPADPLDPEGDARPPLMLIWWPSTVVATFFPLLMLYLATTSTMDEGTGLPTGMTVAVGVFGFITLPIVASESLFQFGARGLRGFWRSFRNTEWGEGM
jgi:MFS family permease